MFIYFSKGSNCDLSLSNEHLREISKPMGSTINVINEKENKISVNCIQIKNLKYFMKSRSISSTKAKKQLVETKKFIEITL